MIIYKPFIRTHLDYGDAIYDQPSKASLSNKTESVKRNPAVAVTGAIKGYSSDKLYQELLFECEHQNRRIRSLWLLCNVPSTGKPSHIHNVLTQIRNSSRKPNTFHVFPCRTEYFKNYFFPHVDNEWSKLDPKICNSSSYNIFSDATLKFSDLLKGKSPTLITYVE